ncbi:MAG: hypothetical protein GKR90_09710 [Pseudomonadales bacterium]|nr:hypothetical protein [Pseudomonadales bacterium]
MSQTSDTVQKFEFGDYEVNLDAFELSLRGEIVAIEPQVFALLAYLVRHQGRLVTKDELLDELWGHRFVSESALSTQVKSLRRAVGDDGQQQKIVQTVRGRGYKFVAEIKSEVATPTEPKASAASHNLPRERTQLLGREKDLADLQKLVTHNRLTSVLGIGGIGKTRLACRAGREMLGQFPDGVWFVDLVPLTGIEALETAVADIFGLALEAAEVRPQLIEAIRDRELLLIFDNCEHLRAETHELLNDFLEFTAMPKFLATSRDPLDLIDEHRSYLEPLAVHRVDGSAPAVQLFTTTAERHGVSLIDAPENLVDAICAGLDGLPLAIELAAAQLRHLTVEELHDRLERRFELLAGRERHSAGRQTNLLNVLRDTWDMLAGSEQALLGQLAVFPSVFQVVSVEEIVGNSAGFARLVDLGLVQRSSGKGGWWRLLETVRIFAKEEVPTTVITANSQRHAEWCLRKLGQFPDDQLDNLSQAEWCLDHYVDLEASENWFVRQGRLQDGYAICAGTGLMVQLDDGARAREKLSRAETYLQDSPDAYWRARLHAIAGLCAQANRAPERLLEHTDAYLVLARELDDRALLGNALLMKSLTTGFVDPDAAYEQLAELVEIGRETSNQSLIDTGECYTAWQLAVGRELERARELAEKIVRRFDQTPTKIDNPAYNCVGILVTCAMVDAPDDALRWLERIASFPAVDRFWGIKNLAACVDASNGKFATSAEQCLDTKALLNRAMRDEFPDLLVTAAVAAIRSDQLELGRKWLAAIRYGGIPIQMYHTITIYRRLYDMVGIGAYTRQTAPSLDDVRAEVTAWWQSAAS